MGQQGLQQVFPVLEIPIKTGSRGPQFCRQDHDFHILDTLCNQSLKGDLYPIVFGMALGAAPLWVLFL
jgi:hypothetical protein